MKSTALTLMSNKLAERFGMAGEADLLPVLKATAFKGDVSDAQMTALMIVANQYGLNPWTKEIYAFPDKSNGIVPVVGVDGWARIINEHPQFDGMDYRQADTMVRMDGAKSDAPEWIECIIHRKDRSRPVVVREYLDEAYRAPFKGKFGDVVGPWQTHPKRFLRHKATIQCARLAFGFAGIYEQDEAERIAEATAPRSMGAAQVVPQVEREPMPAGLLESAENAASDGVAAYQEFWKTTGAANRKHLAEHHPRLKQMAIDADAQRTVDMPAADAAPALDVAKLLERIEACDDVSVLMLIGDDVATLPASPERDQLEAAIAARGEKLEA